MRSLFSHDYGQVWTSDYGSSRGWFSSLVNRRSILQTKFIFVGTIDESGTWNQSENKVIRRQAARRRCERDANDGAPIFILPKSDKSGYELVEKSVLLKRWLMALISKETIATYIGYGGGKMALNMS